MNGSRLIDELVLPLKSFENLCEAASHAVKKGLACYLDNFTCPQPGDWPAQFYMGQLQFNVPNDAPACLKNIVPFIGPSMLSLIQQNVSAF